MEKKRSFIREILLYLLTLTAVLLAVFSIVLISSYQILESEIQGASNSLLKIYSNEFSNRIKEIDSMQKSIVMQREELQKLGSSDETVRGLAAIALHKYLNDLQRDKDIVDAVIIHDNSYDVWIDAIGTGMRYADKIKLRDITGMLQQDDEAESGKWDFVQVGEQQYLYKIVKNSERIIGLYIRTDNLLAGLEEENGRRTIAVLNADGMIGKIWGTESEDIKIGMIYSEIDEGRYYLHKTKLDGAQLSIHCYTAKYGVLQQMHSGMLVVAAAVAASILFMLFLLRYTRREIIRPMNTIIDDMSTISRGEYDKRIEQTFHTREFVLLKDTTNKMVEEIVGLKIQDYEKYIELQDMEMKSIRMQLKPHFFLNALTTISSLSSQGKNQQIKRYIDALSRNVRYMFRAGFHTVSVKEEVKHVENYLEMQELKYPDCVFYMVSLPEELETWKIPQMLIHTFIENEYKYAVSMDKTLTILIKISKQQYQHEEMLLIEIEDDGIGYPQEVLDYINDNQKKISDKGMRIGLWSIKRMLDLMYERTDLLILDNITPHGCLNKIYIPLRTKHELPEEVIQMKI